ncbi:hypothetical protein CRYUN_Cryun15aG0131200 [Craigia yunnanensis]
MADELDSLWAKLSLTEDEQNVVKVSEEWIEETLQEGRNYLVSKVFTRKVVNIEAMRNVFSRI